jgi:hypothetical protein
MRFTSHDRATLCVNCSDLFDVHAIALPTPPNLKHMALLTPLLPDHWLADHPESQLQIRTTEANKKSTRRRSRRTHRRKALDHTRKNRP